MTFNMMLPVHLNPDKRITILTDPNKKTRRNEALASSVALASLETQPLVSSEASEASLSERLKSLEKIHSEDVKTIASLIQETQNLLEQIKDLSNIKKQAISKPKSLLSSKQTTTQAPIKKSNTTTRI